MTLPIYDNKTKFKIHLFKKVSKQRNPSFDRQEAMGFTNNSLVLHSL